MELDKNLIKNNFKKCLLTYEDNAIAQKQTANKLISLIKGRKYDNVLEIGSYSGYLTHLAIENLTIRNYSAIDIVDESEFLVKRINRNIKFYNYDIEEFKTSEKFDLILSNASLQWCSSLPKVIKKIKSYLSLGGVLAISIFQEGNLFEIKDAFNVGLDYPTIDKIKKLFSNTANIVEVDREIKFENPIEILKHLKLTGVNSLKKDILSIPQIKSGLRTLEEKYNNKITYKSVIIID